jgi:hypothetical protein
MTVIEAVPKLKFWDSLDLYKHDLLSNNRKPGILFYQPQEASFYERSNEGNQKQAEYPQLF